MDKENQKLIFIESTREKMSITLDIDKEGMESILELTRQKTKSPALAMPLDEFLVFQRRQAFVARVMAAQTSYQASNDENETLAHLES